MAIVVVSEKASPRFGAVKTGANQPFEQRARPETRLAAFLVEVLHPVEDPVEPGAVGPLEGSDTKVEAHFEGEVDLWGFGPETPRPLPPSAGRIQAQLGKIGHTKFDARNDPAAMRKARPDLHLDLCGIAKGFAVDRVAEYLEQNGASHYLVEIGGEMRVRGGSPYAGAWRIGVEKPVPGRRAIQRVVRLNDAAIATSGDYRIFFESGGARYTHIIDPRTGLPVTHNLASVTVVAPTTMAADAWSTALMVLGPDHGLRLAEHLELAALFIVKTDGGLRESHTAPFGHVLAS